MRLWPYQLISALPRKHLCSQWRECCAISKMINKDGTINLDVINHTTINRIKEYPLSHFAVYCEMVYHEMLLRKYRCRRSDEYICNEASKHNIEGSIIIKIDGECMFEHFHDRAYIIQCMFMFQEKFMSGQIKEEEWKRLLERFSNLPQCSSKECLKLLEI